MLTNGGTTAVLIDHLNAVGYIFGVVQGFKEQFPDACERPAPEPAMDRTPVPEVSGQIASLSTGTCNSEDAVQDEAMVTGRTATLGPGFDRKRLEELPLVVPHQVADRNALLSLTS